MFVHIFKKNIRKYEYYFYLFAYFNFLIAKTSCTKYEIRETMS